MTSDLIENLKAATGPPALETTDKDPFEGQEPVAPAGPRRRTKHQPFNEGSAPPGKAVDDRLRPSTRGAPEAGWTEEQAMQLKVLWDDYEQRQQQKAAPTTMRYRCIGAKPDGSLCGEIVEAGTHEERTRTGEIVRCPHGPAQPAEGILFDRERFPQYHHDLTPMEPIW